MKYIKNYNLFINENLDTDVKTFLAKVFLPFDQAFSTIEYDLGKVDILEVKGIISNRLKTAIDGVQKKINDPTLFIIGDDGHETGIDGPTLMGIISEIIDRLQFIYERVNKSNIKEEVKLVFNAILDSDKGVIPLLSNPSYKYSKFSYEKSISAIGLKDSITILQSKKTAAISLIEKTEQDILNKINSLSDEFIKKVSQGVSKVKYQDDLKKELSEIKEKSPEDIELVYKFAKTILDDKEKKEELEKILK